VSFPSLEPILAFPSVAGLTTVVSDLPLATAEGTVDVWSFMLQGSESVIRHFENWLSEDERERAKRFVHPDDRIRYVLAHGACRAVLARYLGLPPATLRFQRGATGKPILLDHQRRPHALRFNLSHSHGRMLMTAAQGRDIGIDLEQVKETTPAVKLAERFYARDEYQEIVKRTGVDQARQFYRYWVAKEALLKGQGTGLRSLQQCEILCADSSSHAAVRVSPDSTMQAGWMIQWLNCGTGWQAALSAQGNDWSVRVMDE
jgi:4'-phosphopantetheinyl transferase